jgi:hypothetical protein
MVLTSEYRSHIDKKCILLTLHLKLKVPGWLLEGTNGFDPTPRAHACRLMNHLDLVVAGQQVASHDDLQGRTLRSDNRWLLIIYSNSQLTQAWFSISGNRVVAQSQRQASTLELKLNGSSRGSGKKMIFRSEAEPGYLPLARAGNNFFIGCRNPVTGHQWFC